MVKEAPSGRKWTANLYSSIKQIIYLKFPAVAIIKGNVSACFHSKTKDKRKTKINENDKISLTKNNAKKDNKSMIKRIKAP